MRMRSYAHSWAAGAAAEAAQQERQPDSDAAALDVLKNGAFDKALQAGCGWGTPLPGWPLPGCMLPIGLQPCTT